MSEEELAALVTRDSMIGVAKVLALAEAHSEPVVRVHERGEA
jgi:hypothetical protein